MGAREEYQDKLSLMQQIRMFYILRFFANRYTREPREGVMHVDAVRKAVQRIIGKEIGYDDIKSCVQFLTEIGHLESIPEGDTATYRVSPAGVEAYQKTAPLMSQVLYAAPQTD